LPLPHRSIDIDAAGIPEEETVELVQHSKVEDMRREINVMKQKMETIEREKKECQQMNEYNMTMQAEQLGFSIVRRIYEEGWDMDRINVEMGKAQKEHNKKVEGLHKTRSKLSSRVIRERMVNDM